MGVPLLERGRSRSLFVTTDVPTLRRLYPSMALLDRVSDDTHLIVSEPLGELEGAWHEVPEASCVVVGGGDGGRSSRSSRRAARARSDQPISQDRGRHDHSNADPDRGEPDRLDAAAARRGDPESGGRRQLHALIPPENGAHDGDDWSPEIARGCSGAPPDSPSGTSTPGPTRSTRSTRGRRRRVRRDHPLDAAGAPVALDPSRPAAPARASRAAGARDPPSPTPAPHGDLPEGWTHPLIPGGSGDGAF